jgi:hypothetical protein
MPDEESRERVPLKVRIHYTIGNHDWYYHLKGSAFDQIRREVIDAMGLSNPVSLFPYDVSEYPLLADMLAQYKVFGRHGDCFDKFNFNREAGRDYSTLGDVFTMEVINRYPVEAQRKFGDKLPPGIVDSLRKITNVRPALATPLWISGQIKRHAGSDALEAELKKVWDQICDEFLQVDFVRKKDKPFRFDVVDAMELVVKLSGKASFTTINDVVVWLRDKMWGGEISFNRHAMREPAFLNDLARYIVYGHTHHHEIVPLDVRDLAADEDGQVYFNSGTWHSYYTLAIKDPSQRRFVPYQSLTYLAFYKDDEREGHRYETWSGAYA